MFGGELFVGRFQYDDECFKELELMPVTGFDDDWPSERVLAAEVYICKKVVSAVGKRVGQFQIKVKKYVFRDASSHAERSVIVITEHPFFTELSHLLEDSSMTDEEVVNNATQIEVLIDKFKDTL